MIGWQLFRWEHDNLAPPLIHSDCKYKIDLHYHPPSPCEPTGYISGSFSSGGGGRDAAAIFIHTSALIGLWSTVMLRKRGSIFVSPDLGLLSTGEEEEDDEQQ